MVQLHPNDLINVTVQINGRDANEYAEPDPDSPSPNKSEVYIATTAGSIFEVIPRISSNYPLNQGTTAALWVSIHVDGFRVHEAKWEHGVTLSDKIRLAQNLEFRGRCWKDKSGQCWNQKASFGKIGDVPRSSTRHNGEGGYNQEDLEYLGTIIVRIFAKSAEQARILPALYDAEHKEPRRVLSGHARKQLEAGGVNLLVSYDEKKRMTHDDGKRHSRGKSCNRSNSRRRAAHGSSGHKNKHSDNGPVPVIARGPRDPSTTKRRGDLTPKDLGTGYRPSNQDNDIEKDEPIATYIFRYRTPKFLVKAGIIAPEEGIKELTRARRDSIVLSQLRQLRDGSAGPSSGRQSDSGDDNDSDGGGQDDDDNGHGIRINKEEIEDEIIARRYAALWVPFHGMTDEEELQWDGNERQFLLNRRLEPEPDAACGCKVVDDMHWIFSTDGSWEEIGPCSTVEEQEGRDVEMVDAPDVVEDSSESEEESEEDTEDDEGEEKFGSDDDDEGSYYDPDYSPGKDDLAYGTGVSWRQE